VILQHIVMQFHSINAMVEVEELDPVIELAQCDHARLKLECDPDADDGMISIAINPRRMADKYRSADTGVTLILDLTAAEATALVRMLECVLKEWRWVAAHPAPAHKPEEEPPA